MQQEVWITLRFKGEMDVSGDSSAIAAALLAELESHIAVGGQSHGFEYGQPGDVLEIEEESEIYETESADTAN